MDQQDKFANILFFLEELDLFEKLSQTVDLPLLNEHIAEGNSTLVLEENEVSIEYPLLALLGFARTYNSGFNFNGQIKEGSVRTFDAPSRTQTKKNENDEEIIEVRYISHPQKFTEITDASVLVITNSEKAAKTCEGVEISYIYLKEEHNLENIRKLIKGSRVWDLLIFHREQKKEQSIDTLTWIEHFLKSNTFAYNSLRLIFAPYARRLSIGDIIQSHELQLQGLKEESQSAIKQIIPKQTWQFYRGTKALENSEKISTVLLMINHRKGLNRADNIHNINEYSSQDTIKIIGGKTIHSDGVLREILFELNKLPKFGA